MTNGTTLVHIDSHRTPLLFSSPTWVKILKLIVPVGIGLSGISLILIIAQVFYHLLFSIFFIPYIALPLFTFLSFLMLQADLTPYTTGANDNASGAATILYLAQQLKIKPLKNTKLYFVISGCEEVGSYGARAFIKKYTEDLKTSYWLSIDGLSAKNSVPAYIGEEVFFRTVKSDIKMLRLARHTADTNPHLDAFMFPRYQGAYTDSSPAGLAGFKVLSLIALRQDGTLPLWHTLQDCFDNIDINTLKKCVGFAEKFIQYFDAI